MLTPHRPIHHPEHHRTTRLQEPPDQNGSQAQEKDVEPCRIVPSDRTLHDLRLSLRWCQPGNSEYPFNAQGSTRHRTVERDEQKPHHPPAIVLPVNVEDREHNEIGEYEGDHSPETDAAVPEHCGKRDVANRTYERNDGDEWTDQRPPERRQYRMLDEEEGLPELIRHPGGERAGNDKPADDIHPHRGPVHDEIMADGGEAFGGSDPAPDRSVFWHRHIHLGVPFHSTRNP